jgi:hypothetical protein
MIFGVESNEAAERDQRQYALMGDRLSSFRAGSLDLGRTLADLRGLQDALDLAPEGWRDEFQTAWNGLELMYAVAIDGGDQIPDADTAEVRDLVSRLEALVADQLAEA